MQRPAARSKSSASGILMSLPAGAAIFSRAAPWVRQPMTRSPTFTVVTPGPTLSTVPANSAAGENGSGGLVWYLLAIINVSKKFSAAALMRTTASPGAATGSGTSASARSSGVPWRVQSSAFMAFSRGNKDQCRGSTMVYERRIAAFTLPTFAGNGLISSDSLWGRLNDRQYVPGRTDEHDRIISHAHCPDVGLPM